MYVFFDKTYFTNGQTIGKKIMKIRVVSLVKKKLHYGILLNGH